MGCDNGLDFISKDDISSGSNGIYVSFSSLPSSLYPFLSDRAAFPSFSSINEKIFKMQILTAEETPVAGLDEVFGVIGSGSVYFPFAHQTTFYCKAKIKIYDGAGNTELAFGTSDVFEWDENSKYMNLSIALFPNVNANLPGSVSLLYEIGSGYLIDSLNTKITSGKTLAGVSIGSSAIDKINENFTKSDGKFDISSCLPGVYSLRIIVTKDESSASAILQEISVWSGFKTNLWYVNGLAQVAESQSVLTINPIEKRQLFVRGTKIDSEDWYENPLLTAEAGSDTTGDGSIAKPYATILHALSQCKGTGSYAIYVDGKTVVTDEQILIERDITIQGLKSFDNSVIERGDSASFDMIKITENGKLTMKNITLDGSKEVVVENGAGINVDGGQVFINDCIIKNCSTSTPIDGGGAIYIKTAQDCEFNSLVITDSTSVNNGGAIYVCGETTLTIKGSSKIDRCAAMNGSAIYIGVDSKVIMEDDCIIGNEEGYGEDNGVTTKGNFATEIGGSGGNGAIYVEGTLVLKDDVKICGNKSVFGGGVYNAGKMFMYGSAVVGSSDDTGGFANATACSNYASKSGGGIYNGGSVYLGYTGLESGNPLVAQNFTGGVFYNYAAALDASQGGGGIYSATNSFVFISGGVIKYNGISRTTTNNNGGKGLYLAKSPSATSTLFLEENAIIGSWDDYTLTDDNDVFVGYSAGYGFAPIKVRTPLSKSLVAKIDPASYASTVNLILDENGDQVNSEDYAKKFVIQYDKSGSNVTAYFINNYGRLNAVDFSHEKIGTNKSKFTWDVFYGYEIKLTYKPLSVTADEITISCLSSLGIHEQDLNVTLFGKLWEYKVELLHTDDDVLGSVSSGYTFTF